MKFESKNPDFVNTIKQKLSGQHFMHHIGFDMASDDLRQKGQIEEADNLQSATVHWLRHTGISEDVKIRPREHVRDDAGHSSSATTDRYIDVELQARHKSAQNKLIEVTS